MVLTSGGAGLLTDCWLTVAHLVGRRSAIGYGVNWPSRTVIASLSQWSQGGKGPSCLGSHLGSLLQGVEGRHRRYTSVPQRASSVLGAHAVICLCAVFSMMATRSWEGTWLSGWTWELQFHCAE